ncbi:MAG: LysE family translocator [Candidatus Zixiibacteriota bacterium]|nr:MAG: LysE family translocator [candidate division Zixibacteria bacterium]
MTSCTLITFAGALLLMVITPGPGVLACVSRSLTSGFRKAVFVAIGIITGDLIFVLIALCGLASVARLLGDIFIIVKYLGAAYLILLGFRTWTSTNSAHVQGYQKHCSSLSCYLSGLSVTLGNPKAIMFYLSVFPAFLDLDALSASEVAMTVATVLCVLTAVLLTYSLGASRLRVVFRSRRASRYVSRCSGGAMITAGVVLAARE